MDDRFLARLDAGDARKGAGAEKIAVRERFNGVGVAVGERERADIVELRAGLLIAERRAGWRSIAKSI
jgi:hypothetical protein